MALKEMSPEELDAFAGKHLHYEVDMLAKQATWLAAHEYIPGCTKFGDCGIGDAVVEASLLHLRLLHEFLTHEKADRFTDVRAADWNEMHKRAEFGQWLNKEERKAIGAKVAHLSSRRGPAVQIEIPKVSDSCLSDIERFVQLAIAEAEPSAGGQSTSADGLNKVLKRARLGRGTIDTPPKIDCMCNCSK